MSSKKKARTNPTPKPKLMCKCQYTVETARCTFCIENRLPCGQKWTRQEALAFNGEFDDGILFDQVASSVDFVWKFIRTQYPSLGDQTIRGIFEDVLDKKSPWTPMIKEEPMQEAPPEPMPGVETVRIRKKKKPAQEAQTPITPLPVMTHTPLPVMNSEPPPLSAMDRYPCTPQYSATPQYATPQFVATPNHGPEMPASFPYSESISIDEVPDDLRQAYGDLIRQTFFSVNDGFIG